MAFDLERDIQDTVEVPLVYPYIFETDEAGKLILDKDTGEPILHKFLFVLKRERVADIDAEDAARVTKLTLAGEPNHQPVSNVEMLFKLHVSMRGFDDFPARRNDADYRQKFIEYFSREKAKHIVNDALIFHQRIVYPADFFRGVPRRSLASDLSRAAGS
jgi:hypothetical protein